MVEKVATAVAHPNKAVVIYWVKSDNNFFLPARPSLSMTLDGVDQRLDYTVTLRSSENLTRDKVYISGKEKRDSTYREFVRHLDILRTYAHVDQNFVVNAESTFPVGAGVAGSAARAQALATAFWGLVYGYDSKIDRRILSIWGRRGSGSASRSAYDGWVEWKKGDRDQTSYAIQLYDKDYWDVRDLVVMVDARTKKVPSREGMELTKETCPKGLYKAFAGIAEHHIEKIKDALSRKDFSTLGEYYERENSLFRTVCLSTVPSLDYWSKATHNVFGAITELQREGVPVYGGTDAGPNVHILTLPKYVEKVRKSLRNTDGVLNIMHCRPGGASHLIKKHLIVK